MAAKIMLVDGNSIINRAYFALPYLSAPSGEPTGGVYGFLNIFFKIFDEETPDYVLVAFDLPHKTYRHEKYPEYKGNRQAMPETLRPQLPMLKELLKAMDISIYEEEGLEADDILGSLAAKAEKEGLEAVIISGDRDLLQTATDKVKVRIPKTKGGQTVIEDYFAKDVYELYGVTPKEYIDVKALMGDSSDNIPGVPGIGEKTAIKIICEYKNIETAIIHAADIKPKKASQNLVEYKEQAYLSKDLASIITNADIPFPKAINKSGLYGEAAIARFKELGFKNFLNRANKEITEEAIGNFFLCEGRQNRLKLIEKLERESIIALALISTRGAPEGISFYFGSEGYFLAFNDKYSPGEFVNEFNAILTTGSKLIAYDSKAIILLLLKENVETQNIVFDTVLAAYILDSQKPSYTYDGIALDYLGLNYPLEEAILGKGKSKILLKEVPLAEALKFACRHSELAYNSYEKMKEKIAANHQNVLYYDIELPTAQVLASMENRGIKIDKQALTEFESMLSARINLLEGEIYQLTGEVFNINSPKQLGEVLFVNLKLKGGKKTKTGYSTAHDVLDKIRRHHPAVEKVLEYRTLTKLKSTYCEGLLNVIDKETGKIYSTFNQTVTATGRLSSTEPNLQNIPIRTELGRQLRKVFIPSGDEFLFADADYSQIELRVLAHMSGDENMIKAFNEGADIHTITASQVHAIEPSQVSDKQRSEAKAINFGIVYGIGAFSLSEDLGISIGEAENYINAYLNKYKGVKNFMEEAVNTAKKSGYAKTMWGRRREMTEFKNSNYNIRSFGERVAMNMPIQGSAADIMKLAMIKVYTKLKENKFKSGIILQVHDELLLEVAKDEIDDVVKILKEEMERAADLTVPMVAVVSTGNTWFETK